MATLSHFLKRGIKHLKGGLFGLLLLTSSTIFIVTYAVSESFIRSQIEYLIGVIDSNIELQNLDQAGAKNVYIGMREIYKGVIAVLNERIGDTPTTSECVSITDPIERAICESTHETGGGTGSGGSGSTKTSITLLKSGIYNNATDWASTAFEVETDTAGKGYYVIRPTNASSSAIPTKEQLKSDGRSFDINQPEQVTKFRVIVATIQYVTLLPKTDYTIYYYITNDTISSEVTSIPFTTKEAPIPYQKNYRKTCEGITFEGTNRVQNYRWYDTDGKPQDLIQKCSQPNRTNGGLICSESANGCCPTGQVAINGTCISPVDPGGYCYATPGCKDGLSCNNHVCVGTVSTGTGTSGGGTGGSGTGTGTSTLACAGGNQFNFSSSGRNCVGVMPPGPTINYQTTVNAIQGQGTATVRCTTTGWTVITPICNVDKNTTGGTGGSGTGNTGGGTGGSGETPSGYTPGTVTIPSGLVDQTCGTTSQGWSCPGSTSRQNNYNCGVDSIDNSVYPNQSGLCRVGGAEVIQKNINTSNSTMTWICKSGDTAIKCAAKIKVNASCGTASGQTVAGKDTFGLNLPNLCATGTPIKTYQYNGGTQIDPYHDYIIESDGSKPSSDPFYPSTWTYKYTCGGINGGTDTVCKTGKIKENGVCGGTLSCQSGIPNLTKGTQFNAAGIATKTYEKDSYDTKVYWDGEYNWECQGYNGGVTADCRAENGTRNGYCGTYNGRSLETIKNGNYNLMINRTNQSVLFNSSCNGTYPAGVTCASIDYPLTELCTIPTGFGADPTPLLTIIDDAGTDGTFNWKCASMDKIGNPIAPVAECSATKIFPGVCGSNNGATLTSIEPSSNFYQTWGEEAKLRYCSRGYPNYWENQTEPGKFHWYCYIQGATNTQCVADYNPAANTPDPVINSLTVNPSSTTLGSYVSVAWTTSNATSCTIRMPNAAGVMTDFPGQIANGSLTHMASVNGQVTVTATCKNSANETVTRNATYNVSGGGNSGGGTSGGGSQSYTYSWSYSSSSYGSCSGECGAGRGNQSMTAKCLRNDGVESPGNCTGTAPSQNQACTAPASSCTPVSCSAGSMDKYSSSGRKCTYTWPSVAGGTTKKVTLADGSFAQGDCNTDGTWGPWDYLCKDATPTVVTCAGGGRPFSSADGTNECYANYEQRNAGSGVSIGNGLTISGGGTGNATCSPGGYWTFSIHCPGQTKSCPGGAGDLPAKNGDPACVAYYNNTAAGTMGHGTTNLGGKVSGYCKSDGTWDPNSIVYNCLPLP